MKFHLKSIKETNIKNLKTECLVITTNNLDSFLPKATEKYLNKIIQQEKFHDANNKNKLLLLFEVPEIIATRMLLVANNNKQLSEIQFLDLIKNISNHLNKCNITKATILLDDFKVKDQNLEWQLFQICFNITNNLYNFNQYKSKKPNKNIFNELNLIINEQLIVKAREIIKKVTAINDSCKLIKDLANTPPNICTTNFIAKAAINLKKKSSKVQINILEKKELTKLNMGAFLAVAQGSLQPPKLICLQYNGNKSKYSKNNSPIVLIGKGITFDTGGNSLKPANAMIGMKFDMCGAATVIGIINFAIAMQLNLNLVGIIATAENMPGRHACRPDDVVRTMSGITVEILNTDAEGRLILCEALTYCKKFNPRVVIDIATLTGSCAATFGHAYTGLFSNHQELADQLIAAGKKAHDKVWQLPITEEYHKMLESDIADLANVASGGHAGSITAACFLAKFAEKYKWAHLDIAGTAYYQEGKVTRLPSGRSLPMLAEYLMGIINK